MPDFLLLIRETGDLNWSFLTLLPHLRFAAYPCSATSFLVLILSSAHLFLQVFNFYSSETTLDKFYNVNVARGNDLSWKIANKNSKHPEENSRGNRYVFGGNFIDLLFIWQNVALLLVFSGIYSQYSVTLLVTCFYIIQFNYENHSIPFIWKRPKEFQQIEYFEVFMVGKSKRCWPP